MPRDEQNSKKSRVDLGNGIELAYREDDFTDPWAPVEVVLLLHGIAENGGAWRAWVPHLGRDFRVIRVDIRGYGESSALPSDDPEENRKLVEIERLADDMEAFVRLLGCGRVHLVGAKLGALIAIELAQRQHTWIASMTLAGMLASPKKVVGAWWNNEWVDHLERNGVEAWARLTMPGRMGNALSPEAMEWWAQFMGKESARTVAACMYMVENREAPKGMERIVCPTLVMTAGGAQSENVYDQRQSMDDMQRLRARLRNSEFYPLPGADSYHIAATHPDICATKACEFMKRHVKQTVLGDVS